MKLLSSLWSKLAVAGLILSLCIFPIVSTNAYAQDETGIKVTKTANPAQGAPSTEVTFEIVVSNTDNCTLEPVIVKDTLPDGLSYVSGSGLVGGTDTEPTISANILTWNLEALESSVSTTITFKAKIDAGDAGTLTNSTEAIGTTPDGANVSSTATADVTVLSKPYWTKAEILKRSGVPGKGILHAPGLLQKPFNPNSKAAENAGKKYRNGEEEQIQIRQRTENQGNAYGKLKIRQMTENHQ